MWVMRVISTKLGLSLGRGTDSEVLLWLDPSEISRSGHTPRIPDTDKIFS